jgi:hypothetical protein
MKTDIDLLYAYSFAPPSYLDESTGFVLQPPQPSSERRCFLLSLLYQRFNIRHHFRKCVVWLCTVKNHKLDLCEKRLKLSAV